MGIKAIDLGETIRFVSEHDKDEPKTTWLLGVLDTPTRKQIEDIAFEYEQTPGKPESAKAKATFNIGKSELELVAFGLKGFEEFRDKNGKIINFKTEDRVMRSRVYHVVSDEVLRVIPGNIITELAKKIKDINNVSEEETKN